MTNERKIELFDELVNALYEHILSEDYAVVFGDAVGMTEEEMQEYDIIPTLPKEATMEVDSCLADAIEDIDYVEEQIMNYLSDEYSWTVCNFDWTYDEELECIRITNIMWDYGNE